MAIPLWAILSITFSCLILVARAFLRSHRAQVLELQLDWAKHLDRVSKEQGSAALLHQLRRKQSEFCLTEPEESLLVDLEGVYGQ